MILLNLFKDNRLAGIGGLFILTIAIFLRAFIQGAEPGSASEIIAYTGMPFYQLIFGGIHTTPVLNRIVALLILTFISYMIIRIAVRYVLLQFRSLMPAVFFILFSVVLPGTQQVSPALVGSLFFFLCFAILFDTHDKAPDTYLVFNASVALVMGSMFYLKLIWFIPLIWAGLFTLRTVTWREILYPVLAYLLLGLLLLTWYWGVKDNMSALGALLKDNLAFEGSFRTYHRSTYFYYGFFVLLIGFASAYMVNRFQTRKTVTQNIYQVLFFIFVAGILFFVLIARFDPSTLVFMAMPISYILTNYFHQKKNHWTHEAAMWILLGFLLFVQLTV
ncbi:MAG: DUF6427 family protein [Bacteroidota bacterium]